MSDAGELIIRKRHICDDWERSTRNDAGMRLATQSAGDDLIRWSHEAADLIERQAAKIECCEEMLRESDALAAKAQAEIERLREALNTYLYCDDALKSLGQERGSIKQWAENYGKNQGVPGK